MEQDFAPEPLHVIVTPEDNSLCKIYQEMLNLPGCSIAVQNLAVALNPSADNPKRIIHPNDTVVLPNLPLQKFEWQRSFDKPLKQDYHDFIKQWERYIKVEKELDSHRVVIVHGWQTELPIDVSQEPNFKIDVSPPVILDPLSSESNKISHLVLPSSEPEYQPAQPPAENIGSPGPNDTPLTEVVSEASSWAWSSLIEGYLPLQSTGYPQWFYSQAMEPISGFSPQFMPPLPTNYPSGYFPRHAPPPQLVYYPGGVSHPVNPGYAHFPPPWYFQRFPTPSWFLYNPSIPASYSGWPYRY